MKFPLTEQLIDEARGSSCARRAATASTGRAAIGECWHDWPDEGQRRWPLDAKDPRPAHVRREVAFCKEFELR